jgi:hypothetical protein
MVEETKRRRIENEEFLVIGFAVNGCSTPNTTTNQQDQKKTKRQLDSTK